MARKALLVVATVLLSTRPHSQTALVTILVVAFFVLQLKLQPFQSDDVDWMESYSLGLSTALFLLGQFLFARAEQAVAARAVVDSFIVMVMAAFVVGFPLLAWRVVKRQRADAQTRDVLGREKSGAGEQVFRAVELAVIPPTSARIQDPEAPCMIDQH